MELPKTNNEHDSTPDASDSDSAAAYQERLTWRLGGEEPTAQARDLDARLAAENAEAVRSEKAQKRLRERLGGVAANSSDATQVR